ncbi:unnamed protein product [Darwinula stevensoni]|uniref:Chitin-binding type-2 domain-containing protein n=1 Tax=Darwinula stevensoni TaxID=69355 RepID=A0A7R9FS72_9CRUS|nr:unnamed protein product [Darwinula stevensoni]CAG0902941.1 unnamed protein product [Darwinula stevensoni]
MHVKMRFLVALVCLATFALSANASAIHRDLVRAGFLNDKARSCECGCEVLDDECKKPDCGEGTYFQHPEDCGSFCQCSNGKAYYFACPDGLMFNTELNVCDWPENDAKLPLLRAPPPPLLALPPLLHAPPPPPPAQPPPPPAQRQPPPAQRQPLHAQPPQPPAQPPLPPAQRQPLHAQPPQPPAQPPPPLLALPPLLRAPPPLLRAPPPPLRAPPQPLLALLPLLRAPPPPLRAPPPPLLALPPLLRAPPPPLLALPPLLRAPPPPLLALLPLLRAPPPPLPAQPPLPLALLPLALLRHLVIPRLSRHVALTSVPINPTELSLKTRKTVEATFIAPTGRRITWYDCGPGTLWDQDLLTCNHADQVDCGDRPQRSESKLDDVEERL